MKIANRTIKKGQIRSFDLVAAETAFGQVELPCTVIRGDKPGPVLAVTAACHPMELNGVLTSIRLKEQLKPEELAGTVVIVHVQNVFGFMMKHGHTSPLDGINMGGAFRSRLANVEETGNVSHQGKSVTHQIADTVFEKIISKSDYLIDLHGGELQESLMPNIEILNTIDEEVNDRTREFAMSFGFEYIWEVPKGSIPEMPSYPADGSAVMEAMKCGIPGVYFEVGSEGHIDEKEVAFSLKGIKNAMRYLKMLPGKPRVKKSTILYGGNVVFAGRGGLYVPNCKAGDTLKKNQVLGKIISLSGEVLETHRCPVKGVMTNIYTLGVVNPGDMLYVIGKLA